jgi:hypothetical protein
MVRDLVIPGPVGPDLVASHAAANLVTTLTTPSLYSRVPVPLGDSVTERLQGCSAVGMLVPAIDPCL